MAITAFSQWSTTAALNVDLNSIPLDGASMLANQVDDAIREMMAQLKSAGFITSGTFTATITPSANDGAALGTAALSWSDLFLASGGVINWNAGDVTLTHSANALAFAGASSGYSFDGDLLLSKASPTLTIRKSAAAQFGTLAFANGATSRWLVGEDSTAESGSNAGSDFFINRYDDAGAFVETAFAITRSSGLITLGGPITFGGSQLGAYDTGTTAISQGSGITASSGTITAASGNRYYTLIGRQCTVIWDITTTNNGTAGGDIVVTLPFASSSTAGYAVAHGYASTSGVAALMGRISSGATTLSCSNYKGDGVFLSTGNFRISMTYFID